MRFFWLFFTLSVLLPIKIWSLDSPSKPQVIENYRQRNFEIARGGFEVLVQGNPEDAEARYYLALTLTQMGKMTEAAQTYRPLLEKNALYYSYKAVFDPDLALLRASPEFQTLLSQYPANYLVEDKRSFDRIAQSSNGLYLYRNGLEIPLMTRSPVMKTWAHFLNDDWLYYAWMTE